MPTPTQDYQASIDGFLMGTGTAYVFGTGGIDGLGNPPAKTADVPLDGTDGIYASPDYMDARTLLMHLEILEDTDAEAFDALKLLKIAWFPVTADVELHIQLPGWGHIYYIGRPRALDDHCEDAPNGRIWCEAEFLATDPHAHDA